MLVGKSTLARNLAWVVISFSSTTISVVAAEADPHAAHRAMMSAPRSAERSVSEYATPAVVGLDQNSRSIDVHDLLASDTPIIFNFIFTSCQTICPILSATFAQAQDSLYKLDNRPVLVSFSIDPEYDTPARLADYADQFRARDNWVFVTGAADAMLDVQKSYDAYRGDKLNHVALTYMRLNASRPWVKFEGFLSSSDLVAEFTALSHESH